MKAKIFCLSLALENHHQALDACTRFATATARKISCSEPSRRVKGLFVQMLEKKRRTGGRTRPITLPFPLTRSAEKITDKSRLRYKPVAPFRGAGGSADPPRIVKCKSFALSVSSKGSLYISHNGIDNTDLVQSTSITAMVTVCNVLSDDMDVLHNCLSRITITNSEK